MMIEGLVEITNFSEPEITRPTGELRVLRFIAANQKIERLQKQYHSTTRGLFWVDVPVIAISHPDENP